MKVGAEEVSLGLDVLDLGIIVGQEDIHFRTEKANAHAVIEVGVSVVLNPVDAV